MTVAIPPDPQFASTQLLVQANNYEVLSLWAECSHQSDRRSPPFKGGFPWQQGLSYTFDLGFVAERPVVMSLDFITVDGYKVCFYTGISELVDWKMIEEALDDLFPHSPWRTNAMNFHGGLRKARGQA